MHQKYTLPRHPQYTWGQMGFKYNTPGPGDWKCARKKVYCLAAQVFSRMNCKFLSMHFWPWPQLGWGLRDIPTGIVADFGDFNNIDIPKPLLEITSPFIWKHHVTWKWLPYGAYGLSPQIDPSWGTSPTPRPATAVVFQTPRSAFSMWAARQP